MEDLLYVVGRRAHWCADLRLSLKWGSADNGPALSKTRRMTNDSHHYASGGGSTEQTQVRLSLGVLRLKSLIPNCPEAVPWNHASAQILVTEKGHDFKKRLQFQLRLSDIRLLMRRPSSRR
jgi:hypothetical protein